MTGPSPLLVIVGQTASGKSALALELAQKFDGEIIAADSRTVYKGMDIGTAKPSLEEQQLVPHHLLDIVTPDQQFTAAEFKERANRAIEDIAQRKKLPVMVGGTGLYIDSVLFDFGFSDPNAARDPKNPRHIHKDAAGKKGELRSNTLIIGLEIEKNELIARIKKRAETMLQRGLKQEAEQLAKQYGWEAPGLNAIGYREWRALFNEPYVTEKEVIAEIIRGTIAYAKRQKTWFKSSRYDKSPPSGKPFLVKSAPDSLDIPKGMPHSSETDLSQKSSHLHESIHHNDRTERNKSIQWVNEQSKAVEIATTFLYKT